MRSLQRKEHEGKKESGSLEVYKLFLRNELETEADDKLYTACTVGKYIFVLTNRILD
jgi:hypothetical protein